MMVLISVKQAGCFFLVCVFQCVFGKNGFFF